jgi:hypothetical protein
MKHNERRPALRMLMRLVEHAKTNEEIEELWRIALILLSHAELRHWYIRVAVEYKYSLKTERA